MPQYDHMPCLIDELLSKNVPGQTLNKVNLGERSDRQSQRGPEIIKMLSKLPALCPCHTSLLSSYDNTFQEYVHIQVQDVCIHELHCTSQFPLLKWIHRRLSATLNILKPKRKPKNSTARNTIEKDKPAMSLGNNEYTAQRERERERERERKERLKVVQLQQLSWP